MNRRIDLRSDTVTLPTPAMRRAMYEAEVGDDVWGEDPTVKRLQEMAAERVGKEAALFVASGTMGNLVSLLAHCRRGDEVIMGDECHIFHYEVGAAAVFGGLVYHTVPTTRFGELPIEEIEAAIRGPNVHFPPTGLICLENTHNRCGGTVIGPDYMRRVRELADRHGLPIHLDGARIFNAAIALGVDARELARYADSVMFCLSKGLSAPVGSLVCGTTEFVQRAHRVRKMVGGGMRQVGVIAAAGIVALQEMIDRLAEDHENARRLAEGLANIPGIAVDLDTVQTNMVMFYPVDRRWTTETLSEALCAEGVLVSYLGRTKIRAVTHYGIERADIEEALQRIARVVRAGP
ncbi:MAG: low-specificity L-threonine aldolase [Chloroflexia bacterium]